MQDICSYFILWQATVLRSGRPANLPNNWRYDTNTSWYLPFSAMSCHIPCRHLTITACLLKGTTHLNRYQARYVRSEKCLSPWWTNMSACWKIHILYVYLFFLLNTVDLWDIATYTKGSESHPKRLALQSKLQVQTLQSPLSVVFRVFVAYSQVFSMCFSWNQGQLKTHQFEFQVTCSEDSLGW